MLAELISVGVVLNQAHNLQGPQFTLMDIEKQLCFSGGYKLSSVFHLLFTGKCRVVLGAQRCWFWNQSRKTLRSLLEERERQKREEAGCRARTCSGGWSAAHSKTTSGCADAS